MGTIQFQYSVGIPLGKTPKSLESFSEFLIDFMFLSVISLILHSPSINSILPFERRQSQVHRTTYRQIFFPQGITSGSQNHLITSPNLVLKNYWIRKNPLGFFIFFIQGHTLGFQGQFYKKNNFLLQALVLIFGLRRKPLKVTPISQ